MPEQPTAGRCWRTVLSEVQVGAQDATDADFNVMANQKIIVEVLLDIRKLLADQVGARELHDWCKAPTCGPVPF